MYSNNKNLPQRFILAFFSGTGCTKAVCECFEKQFLKLGLHCHKIDIAHNSPNEVKDTDLLIIFSPVYAFGLVSLVESWISNLPKTDETRAAIISVSGGGEISPNTACRLRSKGLLIKKGYQIVYEEMIVMPSNFAIQADQQLNARLIKILPKKVKRIVKDILSNRKRLTNPKLQDRLLVSLARGEHIAAKLFGVSIRASSKCNKCGLCSRNCPNKNIRIGKDKLQFGFRCLWCLKCIYACPCHALSPKIMKFSVLKKGFDLDKMNAMAFMPSNELDSKTNKSILWKGVVDYLHKDSY